MSNSSIAIPAGPNTVSATTSSSLTGLLKGTGSLVAAATAETDYVTPSGSGTLTNKQLKQYNEPYYALATTGTSTISLANGSIQTCAQTGAVQFNLPAVSTAGQALSLSIEVTSNAGGITIKDNSGGTNVLLLGSAITIPTGKVGIISCWSINGGNWRYALGPVQA